MKKHPEAEVVIVGGGWTGGIVAAELSKAGIGVVMLERGHDRNTDDWQHRDELRFAIRHELMQDLSVETWTLRHNLKERALPIRYLGSWLPGIGVGGAGVHWSGDLWRFTDHDFKIRTETIDRYGKSFIAPDVSIEDWGIDYATLEPYYDMSAGGEAPIQGATAPPTAPLYGAKWKQALHDWYDRSFSVGAQLEVIAYKWRCLDLDPTYRDAYGHPQLRITFDWAENERKMAAYLAPKCAEVVQEAGATGVLTSGVLAPHFDTVPYQSTHVTGGAMMGSDPSKSVVNSWLQMWAFPNMFVVGASTFPQNAGKNPTGTVGALAYRLADGLINHYRKSPGHLISA